MALVSKSCIHINEKGKWVDFNHPRLNAPEVGDVIVHKVRRGFFDVWLYYANIIDYARIVMTVVALIMMLDYNATPEPLHWRNITIATLIFGSVLLDWVDGPVARYYGQSSIMGCGWDWLADIFAQYCLAIWCMYMSNNHAFKLFTVLFTGVEISTGIFDFAISATSIYPSQKETNHGPWYTIVEEWLTPGQSYNNLGTFCWLANTMWPISVCLQLPEILSYLLFPFAILYAWHECSQLLFIVQNWKETTATLHQQGMEFVRECSTKEIDLLKQSYSETTSLLGINVPSRGLDNIAQEPEDENKDNSDSNKAEISWINLFHSGKHAAFWAQHPLKKDMDKWVRDLIVENFPNEKDRVILSYGFITAPKNGKIDQKWHLDYAETVSNLFVNMSEVTQKNATQFIRGPLKQPMPEDNYYPNPNEIMNIEGASHLVLNQVISKPFNLFKLYPGVCHRGIGNGENYDRVLFFISTNPTPLDLNEKSYGQTEGNYERKSENKKTI